MASGTRQTSFATTATPLLKRAARLGRELGLTFYDASFLALAVELDCPYITADRRLFERTHILPRVHHLSRVGPLPLKMGVRTLRGPLVVPT
ncbi:MAG: type II toxin-antitoxin system VapC family toxin [Candidatus Methylomirabilales bacterium]